MPDPFLAMITPLSSGRPDNSLPPYIDNTLPVPPPQPSHPIVIPPDAIAPGLPSHPIYLPVRPGHPIVIPPGSLAPGTPSHPIVLPPVYPSHPIVIPPGSIAPGVPSHPIYLPPYVDNTLPGGGLGFWGGTAPPWVDNTLPGTPVPPSVWPPEPIDPLPPELESQIVVAVHRPGQDWVVKTYPVGPSQGLPPYVDNSPPGSQPGVDNTLPPYPQPKR